MRIATALILVSLLAVTWIPAVPAAQVTPAAPDALLPRHVRDATTHGEAALGALDATDARSAFHAALAALATTPGPLGDLAANRLAAGNNGTPVLRYAMEAGDLDGDGDGDLLIDIADNAGNLLAVEARDLATSEIIWQRTDLPAMSLALTAGDGRVFHFGVEITGDDLTLCPSECVSVGAGSITWSLARLDSRNGTAVWTHEIEGMAAGASTTNPLGFVSAGRADAALVLPAACGDVLCATTIAFETRQVVASMWTELAVVEVVQQELIIESTASLLDAASGEVVAEVPFGDERGLAVLRGVPDATGDATPDLLWSAWLLEGYQAMCVEPATPPECRENGSLAAALALVDGATHERAWTAEYDGGGFTFVSYAFVGGDLDADGKQDLVVYPFSFFVFLPIEVRSGATGDVLWSPTGAWVIPEALGAIGGEPGDDLMLYELGSFPAPTLTLARVDGATGAVLVEGVTEVPFPAGTGPDDIRAFGLVLHGHADDDGVLDLAMSIAAECFGCAALTRTLVISGATGATLADATLPGVLAVMDGAQFDGGAADMLYLRYDTPGFVAVGSDGHALWNVDVDVSDLVFLTYDLVDPDGDGRTSLLGHAIRVRNDLLDDGLALLTPEGSLVWSVGVETFPPP